ncbi:hypothetical protein GCM10028805_47480 [Spirosoma harenae]
MAKRNSDIAVFEGDHSTLAILAQAGVSVTMEADRPSQRRAGQANPKAAPRSGKEPGATPSVAVPDTTQYGPALEDIMPWGEGNDFPQRLAELYNQDSLIPATLGDLANTVVGGGVMAVLVDVNEKGQKIYKPLTGDPAIIAEIRDFLSHPKFSLYLREMAADVTEFFNGWVELIISKDRSIITSLEPLNAEECRWCRMRANGDKPFIHLNANWPRYQPTLTETLTTLDPYRPDLIEWMREGDFYKVVYPISYPTPGKRYYSLPHHYSIVESGWLDVHRAIPKFKKFLMQNQMTLKYHWKVDKEYWKDMYGDAYSKGSPAQKRDIKRKWLEQMNKSLTDVTKTGNSIVTDVSWDQVNRVWKDHITVTPITDAITDGKYIQDNMEAAVNILYAFNVDPTSSGFAGGDKMGAKSGGSDKREAHLIKQQKVRPFRDMLLEPLRFKARYDGWKAAIPLLDFVFDDTILTTLDTGAGTDKILS